MICPKSNKPTAGRLRGFTLVEIMMAATVLVVIVALILGMVVYQTRFGVALNNYSEMNTASRQVMNTFENDMRLTRSVSLAAPRQFVVEVTNPTLSVKDVVNGGGSATTTVTYNYDAATKKLTRNGATLLADLEDCQFLYFNSLDAPATNTSVIKKALLAATMRKTVTGNTSGQTTSDYLVSAIVTMRCRNNN